MISEFKTIPKAVYYVQTADGCTVLDPDGDTLAEITAPGGYFPGIASADGGPGTVTFSAPVKRVVGPFDLAPQLLLTLLGQLGGNSGVLPAGYKRVEWLESTGTQRIDTLLILNEGCAVNLDVQKTGHVRERGDIDFFITGIGVNSCRYDLSYYQNRWNSTLDGWARYGKVTTGYQLSSVSDKYNRVNWRITKEEIRFNDTPVKLYLTEQLEEATIVPLMLFSDKRYPAAVRIFYVEITDAPGLVMDLIPALDPTGAPCMFDTVSKQPFYNAGTGDFLYPTESTTYALRRVLPDWGKLTERGLRRLYHAPANYKGELYDYALENGYKPIIEPEMPEEGYWSPHWTETEDEIVLEWVETEPPMDDYLTQPTE